MFLSANSSLLIILTPVSSFAVSPSLFSVQSMANKVKTTVKKNSTDKINQHDVLVILVIGQCFGLFYRRKNYIYHHHYHQMIKNSGFISKIFPTLASSKILLLLSSSLIKVVRPHKVTQHSSSTHQALSRLHLLYLTPAQKAALYSINPLRSDKAIFIAACTCATAALYSINALNSTKAEFIAVSTCPKAALSSNYNSQ